MPRYDENSVECLVFTFKEGLLSAIAHDLKIRVTRFSIDIELDRTDTPAIEARFDARTLRVVTAMQNGAENQALLSAADKRKIEGNIVNEVLHAERHPEIRFVSSQVTPADRGYHVTGQLTLHGRSREIRCTTRPEGKHQLAEVPLHQPDFGIKPYTAMLGTLKVKADLKVRLLVPQP